MRTSTVDSTMLFRPWRSLLPFHFLFVLNAVSSLPFENRSACLNGLQKVIGFLPRHDDPIHDGVEGRTVSTLDSQKVPGPGIVLLLTIVAGNVDHTAELGWDGLKGHSCRHGVPGGHHALAGLGRLFADRTAGVVGGQLTETLPVNGVTTGHLVGGTSRTEEELLTDGTVGFVLSRFAIVVGVETAVDAHATVVTVLEIFGSPHPAESTVSTMVRPFVVGHPEVANITVVFTKLNATLDALVCLARLPCEALPANNLRDRKSINVVMGILGDLLFHGGETTGQRGTTVHALPHLDLGWQNGTVIVTNTTPKSGATAGRNHGAVALVVRTGRTGLLHSTDLFAGLETVLALVALGRGVNGHGWATGTRVVRGRVVADRGVTGRHTGSSGGHAASVRGSSQASTTSIHQVLDRATTTLGTNGLVRKDGFDAGTPFFFFIGRHGAATRDTNCLVLGRSPRGRLLLLLHVLHFHVHGGWSCSVDFHCSVSRGHEAVVFVGLLLAAFVVACLLRGLVENTEDTEFFFVDDLFGEIGRAHV